MPGAASQGKAKSLGKGCGPHVSLEKDNISDIINDRKAEKKSVAEEKRQEGLRRIKEMKSSVGVDPLQRFPKQVWAQIFAELNPEDRHNAYQVHPLFKDLMESTRIRDILLPQILKLSALQRHFHESSWKREFKELAYLRSISKSTRNAIDRSMEDNLLSRIQEDAQASERTEHMYCANFRLGKEEDRRLLSKFLECFGGNDEKAKRFFPRGVSVSFSEYDLIMGSRRNVHGKGQELQVADIRNQFKNDITSLLEIIGDQIWHFRFFMIDQKQTKFSFSETYLLFQRWITLMPNLKWLEFCVEDTDRSTKQEIENLLKEKPLPSLTSVRRLSLHFHMLYPHVEFYEAVIISCSQATILDFSDSQTSGAMLPYLPAYRIKALNLQKIFLRNEDYRALSMRWIDPFMNFKWPLKTLMLELNMCEGKITTLFKFLNKFQTLENVSLRQFKNCVVERSDSAGYLNLPNLQYFYISLEEDVGINYWTNIHFFFSLEFLLRCRKLKQIEWHHRDVKDKELRNHLKNHEESRNGNLVDFRAGLRFLYESNIWDVFPYLEYVRVYIQRSRGRKEDWFAPSCEHEYRREEKGSLKEFKKSHWCCKEKGGMKHCVMIEK